MHAKQIGADQHPGDLVPEMVIDFKTTIARDLPQPKSYKSVMRGPLRRYWAKAVHNELDTMAAKDVWKIVSTPKDGSVRNPIRLTWVLKIKTCEHSTVVKFRARLCALGCWLSTSRQGLQGQNGSSIAHSLTENPANDGQRTRMGGTPT